MSRAKSEYAIRIDLVNVLIVSNKQADSDQPRHLLKSQTSSLRVVLALAVSCYQLLRVILPLLPPPPSYH